uniref:Uncharacterized protein n=1 Tax=Cajanus cajan TaxID=3821 RepID=A0A151QVL7_CAJCA|nr:hypothetical protein KK1_044635 [Cajanus cajan]
MEVNIALLDAMKQIPKYARFLKKLCTHKRKLKGVERVKLRRNGSAMIDSKKFNVSAIMPSDFDLSSELLEKCKDLGTFTIPCTIRDYIFIDAISVQPLRVVEDVLVKVEDLLFPADFYILDMQDEFRHAALILGRPFLRTARTKIDVLVGTLSMEFGDYIVQFNIFEAMKHPPENHSIFF